MADVIERAQEVKPDAPENTEPKEKTVEELVAEAVEKKMAEVDKQHHAEVVGRDKKIDALIQENEKLQKEQMSAGDRVKYDLEKLQRERDEALQKAKQIELTASKREIMDELGIPSKYADRIFGDTPEDIRKDAKAFHEIYIGDVDETANKKVNERLTEAGAPESGDKPKPMKEWDGTIKNAMGLSDEEVAAELLKQIEGD